jgi:hypothetical protein
MVANLHFLMKPENRIHSPALKSENQILNKIQQIIK